MKAVQITQYGGPEVLTYTDVADPTPGPGEAIVQLAASGINYMDVYGRTGLYGTGTLPAILGGEGAGTVVEVGDGVTTPAVGDVVAYTGASQSYAERVIVPADRLIVLPSGITAEQGAAAMLQGMTAHYLSHSTYPLGPDDTALVHAGAGGVGLLLIQMAKMRGAMVITTVSTEEKAELARDAGADHVVLYTQDDFHEAVMRITDGAGCQVAYDSVGATTYEGSMASLADSRLPGHVRPIQRRRAANRPPSPQRQIPLPDAPLPVQLHRHQGRPGMARERCPGLDRQRQTLPPHLGAIPPTGRRRSPPPPRIPPNHRQAPPHPLAVLLQESSLPLSPVTHAKAGVGWGASFIGGSPPRVASKPRVPSNP